MPLKLPICHFDAKTGILCSNCEAKLAKREISKADVEASKVLIRLADKVGPLNHVTLRRSFEGGGNYVLEFEQTDLHLLRTDPKIQEQLETAFGGKVWLVSTGSNDRKFLEEVFFPAKVVTVNTVWLPDGGKRTKVIVPARRSERRIGDFEKLRDAVKRARGIELLVETEREAMLSAWS